MAGLKPATAPLAYSAEDAAAACGISRSLFLREIKGEVFPRYIGAKPVYLEEDLRAWLLTKPLDKDVP